MEHIRQAVERAKAGELAHADHLPQLASGPAAPPSPVDARTDHATAPPPSGNGRAHHEQAQYREIALNDAHLSSQRVISHDSSDPRSKCFDMLRTQVLQAMDLKAWQFVAVTSPAPGCGKTLTAVNLALSIARRSERSVMLVDMDLQKPQVGNYLGLKCDSGLVEVLNGRSALRDAIVRTQIAHQELLVLPTRASTAGSAELLASRAMTATLQQIKRDYPSRTIILDLPPLLSSDDAIAVLPQVDCVLLVTAVGNTTVAQIEECSKHLLSADVVRVVLNKVPEPDAKEYCYY